jgi:hypothetical protein
MCQTGPQALTATVRSILLTHELRNANTNANVTDSAEAKSYDQLRVVRKDFEEYGGIYKVDYDRQYHRNHTSSESNESGHYMTSMNKRKTPCLAAYRPVDSKVLEGKAITMDSRAMYLVREGQKHPFPNYDTFVAMKFDVHYVVRLEAAEFNAIPTGKELPPLDLPS